MLEMVGNTFVKKKGFHIIHMNARSIIPNMNLIQPIIENSNIDVCTISESWLHDLVPDKFVQIPGYKLIRQDRDRTIYGDKKKRGGGLITYISDKIENTTNRLDLQQNNEHLESQWIEIQLPHQKKYIIGNLYRPPNGVIDKAIEMLNNIIEKIKINNNTEIFCLGDLNIDLLKPSKGRKDFYNFVSTNGLNQLIKDPTRITHKTKSLLDVIISDSNCILDSGILYNNVSDHFQVYVTRKHIKKQKKPTTFNGRNYANYDILTLQQAIDQIDWSTFLDENDPNIMWDIYLSNITEKVDALYPVKNYHINQQKESWINDDLMHMIIEKDRLILQAKIENTEIAWNIAKQAKNRTKNFIQRAKTAYISDALETNRNNPKAFWRTINSILPNKKDRTSEKIVLKDQNTQLNIQDKDIPDYINDYFSTIGPKLAQNYNLNYNLTLGAGAPQEVIRHSTHAPSKSRQIQNNLSKDHGAGRFRRLRENGLEHRNPSYLIGIGTSLAFQQHKAQCSTPQDSEASSILLKKGHVDFLKLGD